MNEKLLKYENENIDTLSSESLRDYCRLLKDELDRMTAMQVQSYQQSLILRRTIKFIIEKNEMDMGEVYTAIADGNGYSLDDILYFLSR